MLVTKFASHNKREELVKQCDATPILSAYVLSDETVRIQGAIISKDKTNAEKKFYDLTIDVRKPEELDSRRIYDESFQLGETVGWIEALSWGLRALIRLKEYR
jgi:hypothetical protein